MGTSVDTLPQKFPLGAEAEVNNLLSLPPETNYDVSPAWQEEANMLFAMYISTFV